VEHMSLQQEYYIIFVDVSGEILHSRRSSNSVSYPLRRNTNYDISHFWRRDNLQLASDLL